MTCNLYVRMLLGRTVVNLKGLPSGASIHFSDGGGGGTKAFKKKKKKKKKKKNQIYRRALRAKMQYKILHAKCAAKFGMFSSIFFFYLTVL